MNENYFIDIFQSLISHKESEVVEFKKAENNFDFDDLGKYFSALSNEANLRGLDIAWLIFGYDEKKHEIVGTSYKNGESALNNLKHDFAQHTTDGQTFREIVPIEVDGKRILMFKIPASPRNIVMKWKGIAFGRDGESLKPLNQSKMDEIRHQTPEPDWSAELVPKRQSMISTKWPLPKLARCSRKYTAAYLPRKSTAGLQKSSLASAS